MLAYLETAGYSIREEMVLKVFLIQCMMRTFTDSRKSTFLIFQVAILAEKYATDYKWYGYVNHQSH